MPPTSFVPHPWFQLSPLSLLVIVLCWDGCLQPTPQSPSLTGWKYHLLHHYFSFPLSPAIISANLNTRHVQISLRTSQPHSTSSTWGASLHPVHTHIIVGLLWSVSHWKKCRFPSQLSHPSLGWPSRFVFVVVLTGLGIPWETHLRVWLSGSF